MIPLRRRAAIASHWRSAMIRLLQNDFAPRSAAYHLRENNVLSAVAAARYDRFVELPVAYNYPVQNWDRMTARGITPEDAVLWHYQPFFDRTFARFAARIGSVSHGRGPPPDHGGSRGRPAGELSKAHRDRYTLVPYAQAPSPPRSEAPRTDASGQTHRPRGLGLASAVNATCGLPPPLGARATIASSPPDGCRGSRCSGGRPANPPAPCPPGPRATGG